MSNFTVNKKYLASAVTAAAVATAFIPTASADEVTFTDVSSTYKGAVDFLVANEITEGLTDSTFGTTSSIKRVDAAVLIARAIGFEKDGKYKDSGFKDVPARAKWAVDALYEAGIIDGLNSKEFGSDATLTRNQTAKILANAAKLKVNDTVKKTAFEDVNSNFAKYVEALVNAGVTRGKNDKSFGAYDNVTRGEMALFLNRAKENYGYFDLTVMHMNDTHGYLDRFPYMATAINDLRKQHKNNILLHAGDVFSGDLYSNAFKGKADLELMNHLDFDAVTFGNHEFDGGPTDHLPLSEFVKGGKFPFVSANINFSKDPLFNGLQTNKVESVYKKGHIYDGVVLNINGQKVGVFGLTTEDTPNIASPEKIEFTNYVERAKASVAAFEEAGIDKIIALTHLGYDSSITFGNDLELAKQVEGIDIIVGGHSHSKLTNPVVSKQHDAPTIIVQANEYGKVLGTLDVSFNKNGEVYAYAGKLINTDPDDLTPTTIKPDKTTMDILAPYAKKVSEIKEESIGVESLVKLDGRRAHEDDGVSSVRYNETNLGNLMTDAMLAKAKTINDKTSIALQNGGGIRSSIAAGDVTVGDVLRVMPYGNALALVEMSGTDIRATLEHSVAADVRDGGKGLKENGAFLHVSGMKFTYDSTLEKGKRVKTVQILDGDKYVDLDDSKTYIVATNNFTAKGGDGFKKLEELYKAGKVSEPGFVDYENFIEYVKSLGGKIEAKVEGRIIDLALSPAK